MKLFGTMDVNQNGHLEVGGIDTSQLVKEYNTPLYVMDEEQIRDNCRVFNKHFQHAGIKTEIIYASKAFLTRAMCKLIEEEGLSLDVVSGGELYTALQSGFPVERIYFHGNNKSYQELEMAIEVGVGRIIVDHREEIEVIEEICQKQQKKSHVLLRVNPGIEAHTHEYITTTKNDSKFGESIFHESIYTIINRMAESPHITFMGIHSHIGSQIFEAKSFFKQIEVLLTFVKTIKERVGVDVIELNLGGGFGIYYVEGDLPMDLNQLFHQLLEKVETICEGYHLKKPKVMIEPGRSIVANAGITLYTVGATKETFSGKHYVFVDGSMADNIRTALYSAEYEAALANRMSDPIEETYTVSGKCCESGDLLIRAADLPKPKRGDILVVASTGAYNYSMASNYNRLTKPAVVFVKDGQSRLVVKRETYADLIRNDVL